MFRQHKVICENKEVVIYLFLYDQDIDLDTMKNIFNQLTASNLEQRTFQYFKKNHIKFLGNHIKIVYHSTIIKDLYLHKKQLDHSNIYATNVVNLF